MRVGIVAVSHSLPLAAAARDLALEMVAGDAPPIALAAGAVGGFGTDAVAVSEAIAEVSEGAGVVVLVDLGSAVLSAEMALEFLPDPETEVRVVPAPFVEGLLAATVCAATGGSLDEVAAEAQSALQPKLEQLGVPAGSQSDAQSGSKTERASGSPAAALSAGLESEEFAAQQQVTVPNPMGLHARPAATLARTAGGFDAEQVLIFGGKQVNAKSPLAVAGLGTRAGDEITVAARGTDAAAAVAALSAQIAEGFGEVPAGAPTVSAATDTATDAATEPEPGADTAVATASAPASLATAAAAVRIGVSPGRVVGQVRRMVAPPAAPTQAAPLPEAERQAALHALHAAIAQVGTQLRQQAADSEGQAAEILTATAQLAEDPLIPEQAGKLITASGLQPEAAVWQTLNTVSAEYAASGGALAERVSDVRSVRDRLVAQLTGQPLPGVPQQREPFILVARDLAPADTSQLDPRTCLGLLLGEGGPTSHTAILARSYGIPAVVDSETFLTVADGDTVLLDGATAQVIVTPDAATAATARSVPRLLSDLAPLTQPGRLLSGEAVDLLANIGGAKDARTAVERGAQGVGLFRTEFCFLGRQSAPSFAEQLAAYGEVFAEFRGAKVVVRTLDAGSDKPLPFVTEQQEENPALGLRGFRTSWQYPAVLETQLAAIAAAAAEHAAEPWVMAPMIATAAEAARFVKLAREAGLNPASGAKLGVMLETPAAALTAAEIFTHVDFVSLGTNDLAQYTMAADRMVTRLAHLHSAWQPAVLRLIAQVGTAAATVGKPVGVCGEAAADPLLAGVLVGLGVNSLSMTAAVLPVVAEALAGYTLDACRGAAQAALRAADETAARQAAAAILGQSR